MTVTDIVDGIIQKKNAIGMTNQQLADASGVPKATIDRILRHDTPNPTMQTVLDLAAAVGYSFSNHQAPIAPIPEENKIRDPMTLHMIDYYERRGVAYEERIKRITAHFNMLLAEKNRWIKFSLILNIILIVFLVTILIVDILHPDIGWVREQLNQSSSSGFGDFVLKAINWLQNM